MTTATSMQDSFRQAIEAAGLTPPDEIIADGKWHRFASNGDRRKKPGYYRLFADGVPSGAFGCFRADFIRKWSAKSAQQMSETERADYRRRIEETVQRREAKHRRDQAEAAQRARRIWEEAQPATADHPYLKQKHVQPHGLRVDRDNRLIVPVMIDNMLASVEYIDADGDKHYLWRGRKQGGSFTFGELEHAQTLLLGEGFATVATVHEATDCPAVMAFDAGNLLAVAQALRQQYPDATILVCGDNDLRDDGTENTGVLKATAAADAIGGLLTIPDAINQTKTDWNDVHVQRGLDAVRHAIEAVLTPPSDWRSGAFAPVTVPQLLDEAEPARRAWVWEDFLPEGSLGGLVAKPKVGKTTNAYELTVKVAQGLPYLGRETRRGAVLILALEEHRREVKQRLRNLGADLLDTVHVHVGPLADSPETFHQLHTYIVTHQIVLVIFDTLNTFWSVKDENDAVGVTEAIKPLLRLARESGAAVLLLHHARKSEGEFGDEIRGSGALFSLLDIALILKRHDVETHRKLTAISRYPETPPELIIELRDHGHEALGDPAAVGKVARIAKVRAALTKIPTTAVEIGKRAGVSRGATYTILDGLVGQGHAQRTGTGKRNDPHLYVGFVSVSPLRGGGQTKRIAPPTRTPMTLPPTVDSFRLGGLSPGEKRNETQTGWTDSFRLGGTGGKRNEMRLKHLKGTRPASPARGRATGNRSTGPWSVAPAILRAPRASSPNGWVPQSASGRGQDEEEPRHPSFRGTFYASQ